MLEVNDLHSGYPRHPVLQGVSFQISDGSRTAILGRNGVGKSTLVKTITGELKITSGDITLDGIDIGKLPMHHRVRRGISHVPQGRGIFADLTVLENLRIPILASKLDDGPKQLEAMLDGFPILREFSARPAGQLSGGQLQLLAFARAMLTQPRIIILDEPSEGIQPSIVDDLTHALLHANAHRGVSVVLVEQNLGFAASVAEDALIIDRGVVSAKLAIAELEASRELQKQHLFSLLSPDSTTEPTNNKSIQGESE